MSAQQVLFDAPGPKAVVRHRMLAVLGAVAIGGLLAWILWRMNERGQLEADRWTPFIQSSTWTNYYIPGLVDTLRAASLAIVLSMILGLGLAMGRMSDVAPIRWASTVFVEFFRAVPVLIMMIFTFFYLSNAQYFPNDLNPLLGVLTGLVLYNSSVICEVVRSGVKSLPNGQREAGLSIGLTSSQTRRLILVPQALTSMLPTLVSQIIVIVKDTALGAIILYPELLRRGQQLGANEANILPAYVVAAALFIILNYGISKIAEGVEARQRRTRRTPAPKGRAEPAPEEDQAGPHTDPDMAVNIHAGGGRG